MSDIAQQKSALRKQLKAQRNAATPEQTEQMNDAIFANVTKSDFYKAAKCVFIYVSFASEVDTHKLILGCVASNKKVVVPVVQGENLDLSQIFSMSELERSKLGVLEPRQVIPINIEDIDLVIAPGLAFSESGDRLGYGGGYYDRVLGKLDNVKVVGLCYEFQIVPHIPKNEFDRSVDIVATNERVIVIEKKSTNCC